MGQFLGSIEQQISQMSKSIPNICVHTLQKIYEYHGIYKSVCDSFSIKRNEFEQIFGSQESFSIWEREHTDKLDALELFTGIAVVSVQASFKEKLRFLFELFDFNEVRSISTMDFQYMLVCICNSTFKMLGKNAKVSNVQVSELVKKHFGMESRRIIITELLKKCQLCTQIKRYFELIGKEISNQLSAEKKIVSSQQFHNIELNISFNQEAVDSQQFSWYSKLAKKIAYPNRDSLSTSKCYPRWVYGIEVDRINRPFLYLNQSIVYAASSLAVIYYIQQNEQKIYHEHHKAISSITYSKKRKLLATAERCNNPSIHIWQEKTLETIKVIVTGHLVGVSMMSFADLDKRLLTLGSGSHNSVLIYSMDSFELICSSCLPGQTLLGLIPIYKHFEDNPTFQAEINRTLVSYSSTDIYFFEVGTHFTYKTIKLDQKISSITSCCALFINTNRPTARSYSKISEIGVAVTGHTNGELCLSFQGSNFQILTKIANPITQIDVFEQGIAVSSASFIYLFDFGLLVNEVQPFCKVSIQDLSLKLLSTQIRCFALAESRLLVMTSQAQMISIDSQQTLFRGESFDEVFKCQKISTLFRLTGQARTISIIQKQDFEDRILFFCCSDERIIGLSLASHEIIDMWSIPDQINVIDTVSCDDGLVFFVLGCKSGRLYIRVDWEQSPRCYNCASQIVEVKLAFDGSYLLACTKDRHLFVFSNSNNSFVSQAPRKIHFDNESPCSVSFADDNKSFLVCMDSRNIYQFYLPELKHKSALKDSDRIYISQLSAVFCLQVNRDVQLRMPGLLGGGQKVLFLTDYDGTIRCYQNQQELESNSYTKLFGHTGSISKLLVPAQQDCLISLGSADYTMVEWALEDLKTHQPPIPKPAKDPRIQPKDILSYRQKKQSTFDGLISDSQRDSFVMCKGVSNPSIQQSLNDNGSSDLNNHREASISLAANYVYGFECSNKRNTVLYDQRDPSEMYFFSSRFVSKLNSNTLQQTIIQKPRMRVSCIALSSENVLAIGEASKNPCIYFLPDMKFQTSHKDGIIHMSFYQELLFSFGVSGSIYSINIHNVNTGERVKERFVQERIDKFFILSRREFVSIENVHIWRDLYPSQPVGEATAGDLMGKDVCLGSPKGDLLILSNSRLFTAKKQAHDKAIIALRHNESSDHFSLITAGDDELIKIWNKNFKEIACVHLRSEQIVSCLTQQNAVTSPDQPLRCYSLDIADDKIVAGLSNGQLLKLELLATGMKQIRQPHSIGTSFMISESLISDKPSDVENYSVKHTQLMAGHARPHHTGPSCCFSLHPRLPIIVSSCCDGQLVCTNYNTKAVIGWYCFERINISCLKFSPNQKFLAVGFETGQLRLYEPSIKPSKDCEPMKFTLNLTQYFETMKSAIIAIEFSKCSTFLAVSYMPAAEKKPMMEDFEENPRSTVVLFRNKDSNSQRSENHYFKHCEFKENITEVFKTEDNALAVCATFMSFIGDQQSSQKDSSFYLVLYYQSINQQRIKVHRDTKAQYRVFDIRKKCFLKDEELSTANWWECLFPNSIHCRQLHPQAEPVPVAEMLYNGSNMIYGSVNGDIIVAPRESLASDRRCADLKESQMYIGKTFAALTSCISQMELSHDSKYLFVSSVWDGCILQMRINEETRPGADLFDRDLCEVDAQEAEIPNKTRFYNYINNVIPARELISSILEDIEDQPKSQLQLSLSSVIGRRAFDRRKNLFFDGINKLVYSLGPNIILQDINSLEPRKLTLIKGDPEQYTCSPQISCFTIDQSCQLLALATEQQKSKIVVWGIHTRLCLASTRVNCTIVQNMCFSKNNRLISLYGITDAYHPVVMLLDWKKSQVLSQASLLFDPVWTIKDMTFHQSDKFLTCGVQHLRLWSYNANMLTSESYDLEETPDVTFTVVASVKNRIVTACENGYVYLWGRGKPISRLKVHEAAVRCMGLLRGTSLLITGGVDARVCTIQISDKAIVIKNQETLSNQENKESKLFCVRYDIQAICLDHSGNIFVGTRSGDIFKLRRSEPPLQMLFCDDHDRMISVCFSEDSSLLYSITSMGHLQIWDLRKTRIGDHHFRSKCLKILSFKKYIILVQQKSIAVVEMKGSSLTLLQQYQIGYDTIISDARLSLNCKLLAVATSRDKNELHIYDVDPDGFKLVKTHVLTAEVQFLDFSNDDRYLLFKDKAEDLGIIETKELKRINTIFIEYDIEWSSDGTVINQKAMNIHSCYHRENTITKIAQLGSKYVLVADQIGTLRLFDYPCSSKRVGELHLRCYSEHMNFVTCLEVSPDGRWVASIAEIDRALIIWKVADLSVNS